jgi:cobalt/nickel transport system ATP-binding protein
MVAVAGVSAMCPKLVIYDEPSSNLDIRSRRRLIGFLQRMPGTLMIASHDLEFILEVCDRVILLDEGQIVADGLPHDILGDSRLMDAHGLECPHSLVPHEIPHHD